MRADEIMPMQIYGKVTLKLACRGRIITFNESSFLTALIRMYLLPSTSKTRSHAGNPNAVLAIS